MKKYELTDQVQNDLTRIRALVDIPEHEVKKGNLGGWVEGEHNLSHDGECWIADHAKACGRAMVVDDALVCDFALLLDTATVCGSAIVGGHAIVMGGGVVSGDAINACVIGNMLQ